MKISYLVGVIAIVGVLSGCQKAPESSNRVGQGFNVEKLFTVDGCTVYRFLDDRSVYFTNCPGSTKWQQSCGKNCTQNVGVN